MLKRFQLVMYCLFSIFIFLADPLAGAAEESIMHARRFVWSSALHREVDSTYTHVSSPDTSPIICPESRPPS